MGGKSVNKILERRREKLWEQLQPYLGPMHFPKELFPKIGSWKAGFHEIQEIAAIHQVFLPFFLEVTFHVLWAHTGKKVMWHMRFNTGMALIPMVGDSVLLKKEPRPSIGKKLRELPRCFANLHEGVDVSKDRSLTIIKEILRTEKISDFFLDQPIIDEVILINEGFYENTGTDANKLPIYLVKIKGEENPDRLKKGQLITWSLHEMSEVEDILEDAHSISTFALYQRYLRKKQIIS